MHVSIVESKIERLMQLIVEIPGQKIVTLVTQEGEFIIDINQDGDIGYLPEHKYLFCEFVRRALHDGGGILIRQFLPINIQKRRGAKKFIPVKNLYGIWLNYGDWLGIDASVLQQCCETDANSGAPLPRERGVVYRDFPLRKQNMRW